MISADQEGKRGRYTGTGLTAGYHYMGKVTVCAKEDTSHFQLETLTSDYICAIEQSAHS